MLQAFSQMLAQQQAQTMDLMGGIRRPFQEAMQGMMAATEGARKGNHGGKSVESILKPVMSKEEQNKSSEWGFWGIARVARATGAGRLAGE